MRKAYISLIIIIAMMIILGVSLYVFLNEEEYSLEVVDFSRDSLMAKDLINIKEVVNINLFLEDRVIENGDIMGFSLYENSVNLQELYYLVLIETVMNKQIVNDNTRNQFKLSISRMDTSKLNVLELMQFYLISDHLDVSYEIDSSLLDKYYSHSDNLFYIFSSDDNIGIKLIITSEIFNNIGYKTNNIEENIMRIYRNYTFDLSKTNTLYNSGGDIIYALMSFDLFDESVKSATSVWFESWYEYYESLEVTNFDAFFQFTEFLNIAINYGDTSHQVQKIQNYYNSFVLEDLNNFKDLFSIYILVNRIDASENIVFEEALINKVKELSDDISVIVSNVDIQETYYGIMLSNMTGYDINSEKVTKLLNRYWYLIKNENNIYTLMNYLYFYIKINNLLELNLIGENEHVSIHNIFIQTLEKIHYSEETMYNDIIVTKKILELISDGLQDESLYIKTKHANKIKNALKRIKQSYDLYVEIFYDIFVIDYLLKSNYFVYEDLINVENALQMQDGGLTTSKLVGDISNIYTTFNFVKLYLLTNQYDNLSVRKEYITKLVVMDGIYTTFKHGDVTLKSIYIGNTLKNMVGK